MAKTQGKERGNDRRGGEQTEKGSPKKGKYLF